jgi:thioredoxin-like negative regulator of GroEL
MVGAALGGLLLAGLGGWAWARGRPARLADAARAAAAREDWPAAARLWAESHARRPGDADGHLAEAHAALAAGRAAQAERALERACALAPELAEPWLLRLEVLRVEDRPLEAQDVGWRAYASVPPALRAEILRALTLALLAETPDDLARRTLARWAAADPADLDARVALRRRAAVAPRDGDPTRAARIAELAALLESRPDHVGLREATVLDLADAGEPDRGRALLDAWPEPGRDARYLRLAGRWALEYDGRPAAAAVALREALRSWPHDWPTRYRLARALAAAGDRDAARAEAEAVRRLREALDPARLGPRLDAALARPDDPDARRDLAALAAQVGLDRLAAAWRQAADEATPGPAPARR